MENLEFFFDTKLFHVRAEWPAVCVQEATAYSFANCIQMGRKGPAHLDGESVRIDLEALGGLSPRI